MTASHRRPGPAAARRSRSGPSANPKISMVTAARNRVEVTACRPRSSARRSLPAMTRATDRCSTNVLTNGRPPAARTGRFRPGVGPRSPSAHRCPFRDLDQSPCSSRIQPSILVVKRSAAWVATRTVAPFDRHSSRRSSTRVRPSASRAAYGSSSRTRRGWPSRIRPSASRRRMPAEKRPTRSSRAAASWTRSSAARPGQPGPGSGSAAGGPRTRGSRPPSGRRTGRWRAGAGRPSGGSPRGAGDVDAVHQAVPRGRRSPELRRRSTCPPRWIPARPPRDRPRRARCPATAGERRKSRARIAESRCPAWSRQGPPSGERGWWSAACLIPWAEGRVAAVCGLPHNGVKYRRGDHRTVSGSTASPHAHRAGGGQLVAPRCGIARRLQQLRVVLAICRRRRAHGDHQRELVRGRLHIPPEPRSCS